MSGALRQVWLAVAACWIVVGFVWLALGHPFVALVCFLAGSVICVALLMLHPRSRP